MGERRRVDQDESGSIATRDLHAIHQHMLGVGLQVLDLMPCLLRLCCQCRVDLRQRGVAIDIRLTGAQQVQIGAMEDQQFCHDPTGRRERAAV
ncbi:hypothetical protein D3C81_1345360 [compost metagenome]